MTTGKTTGTVPAQDASTALKQALAANDPHRIVGVYADDAEVTAYSDRRHGQSPNRISGRKEIEAWVTDYVSRNYDHKIVHELVCDDGFAWIERWTLPTGEHLISTSIYTVHDGKIAAQHGTETSG